jgi:hypothetical protein
MQYGVQMHNLTALQILNFLREQLEEAPRVDKTATSSPAP